MGYVTIVIVRNDALGYIEADPGFGRRLAKAIRSLPSGNPVDVSAGEIYDRGIFMNAATAVKSHHISQQELISVGGESDFEVVTGKYVKKR